MDPAPTVTKVPTGPPADPTNPAAKRADVETGDRSREKKTTRKQARVAKRPTPELRQSRVEMTRVDLWSVLKVSLCFYLAGLAVLIIAGLVVWLLLDASGGIRNFERFMGDIMSADNYRLVASRILAGSALIGLVLVALMTILTVIAAALYNVFSDLVGGVEVTLVEAE